MKQQLMAAALALGAVLAACGGTSSPDGTASVQTMHGGGSLVSGVSAPPAGLSNFNYTYYRKYVNASGVPIVASATVSDSALLKMKQIVDTMLSKDSATRTKLVANLQRILIIPRGQGMTTLPEYWNLDQLFPLGGGQTWDQRAQGIGWTAQIPYVSCSEANLLHSGWPDDRYTDESICIHEFAHAMWEAGVVYRDSYAQGRLDAAYSAAKARGFLGTTYAASSVREYWAEGVQGWFNAASCNNTPTCTQSKLYNTDPTLWNEIGHWYYTPAQLATQIYP
jgi:hypothetical protein